MKVFYSDKPLTLDANKHSIFLAGPTPRSKTVKSWRPEALQILNGLNYDGQVIVPEPQAPQENFDYNTQVEWENLGTESCNKLVFWIPRKIDTMPAFTTNVEFGRYVKSGKILYGRPPKSEKNTYLDWLYTKFNQSPIYDDLQELLKAAIQV
jgi:hypothetical protein